MEDDKSIIINVPEMSNWECALFGGDFMNCIIWNPVKGCIPNRFWRLMQFLIFGNRWRKKKNGKGDQGNG